MLLRLLVACSEAPSVDFTVTLDPDFPLRATAKWNPEVDAEVLVEGRRIAPSAPGEALLLGLPADTELTVSLVEGESYRAQAEIVTSPPSAAVPSFDVTRTGDGFGDGWILTTHAGPDGAMPVAVLLDGKGRVCWYHELTPLLPERDPRSSPAPWAVRLTPEAAWVSLMSWGGGLARIPFDGTPAEVIELRHAHHDFELLPDGGFAYTRFVGQEIEGELVTADELVVRSAEGAERTVWNAFQSMPVERHAGWDAYPETPGDWTHANGIAWNADAREWTLSLYWLQRLVVIDDATGAIVRTLDGNTGPEPFGPQHAPSWSGEGWWFFDNGSFETGSRALHLAPDGASLESWAPPGGGFTPVIGDVTATPDERLLVTMGPIPDLWAVGADREVRLRVSLPPEGNVLGQVAWTGELRPTTP
jgi:hypothetical protein